MWHVTFFWKVVDEGFPKKWHKLTFYDDKKIQLTWSLCRRWPNFFYCHPTRPLLDGNWNFLVPQKGKWGLIFPKWFTLAPLSTTKSFQLPSDGGVCWMATEKIQSPKLGGMSYIFGKPSFHILHQQSKKFNCGKFLVVVRFCN
jgi:hypothetical protein